MVKVWCFYHRVDLDGHCAGAVVRKWCWENGHEFVPRGVNYGEEVKWSEGAGTDSMAVIVDFTPEGHGAAETLLEMQGAYGGGVVWIDHHKTAIDKVGQSDIDGIRENGTAGCELAWRHFFPQMPMPGAVRLLGRYDVFDRSNGDEWETMILPFQYGMRMHTTRPDSTDEEDLWKQLFSENDGEHLGRILHDGGLLLRFEQQNNARAALFAAYDCTFEGLPCSAMNGSGNSLVLDAYARPEHKMRILWRYALEKWRVSLYENGHDDVDCGAIAQMHGGGGHKGAAGFSFPGGVSPLVYFPPKNDEG